MSLRERLPTGALVNRRISYWALGLALVTIAVFATQRTVQLRDEQAREETRRAERELATMVSLWEGLITDRISSWMLDMADAPNASQREQQVRDLRPWFDAYYLWVPASDADGQPTFLYPKPSATEDLDPLLGTPCMRRAHSLTVTGKRMDAAEAYLECTRGTPNERLLAGSMAASLYLQGEQPSEAWVVLAAADPPLNIGLATGSARGLPISRLVTRRLQAARAQELMGQAERQRRILVELVLEITALNGPDLEQHFPNATRAMEQLTLLPRGAAAAVTEDAALNAAMARATKRLAAYTEVSERLSRRIRADGMSDGPKLDLRVVHDMYSESTFMLVYAALDGGARVAAVQVDTNELLNALLESAPKGTQHHALTVLDANGKPVRGGIGEDGNAEVFAAVPFGRLLPHLRLGQVRSPAGAKGEALLWIATQLLPVSVALILGLLAIVTSAKADRRQDELLERQQAFIARVTHELKTPLAGIRVMAETLEMGAAEPVLNQEFLRRIIKESERLGSRIDEVLTVARRPEIRARSPVDPQSLAAEVAHVWKQRMSELGGTLETDFRPCGLIAADPALLRDALTNLLDNALKYRREDRRLLVRFRVGEMGRWVVFEVSDNGIGVPDGMRKKVFERFARVEGAGRGRSGGHGLGLSFVAEAAAAHGGLVECLAGIDGGARFRIKLRRG